MGRTDHTFHSVVPRDLGTLVLSEPHHWVLLRFWQEIQNMARKCLSCKTKRMVPELKEGCSCISLKAESAQLKIKARLLVHVSQSM